MAHASTLRSKVKCRGSYGLSTFDLGPSTPEATPSSGTDVENDRTRVGHTEIQMPQLMQLLFDISKDLPLRAKDLTGTPTSQKRSHMPQAMHRSFRLAIPNVRIDFGLALWNRFITPTAGHQ